MKTHRIEARLEVTALSDEEKGKIREQLESLHKKIKALADQLKKTTTESAKKTAKNMLLGLKLKFNNLHYKLYGGDNYYALEASELVIAREVLAMMED